MTAQSPMCWSVAGSEWPGVTPQIADDPGHQEGARVQDQRSCRIERLFVFPAVSRKRKGCEALHPSAAGKRIFGGAVGRDCKRSGARCKAGSVCVRVSRNASESTVHPTGAAIQRDIDAIIDSLSERGRRGVVIGLSMGGIFAIQSLKRSNNGDLRALVDSAPARVPTIPFLLRCPRWMNPLDAATADVVKRLCVLYAADDWWSKDPAAKELMEKVKAGGGRVWMIEGGHVDLSLSGLALRLPIYVDFVQQH